MRSLHRHSGLFALFLGFLGLVYFAALRGGTYAQVIPPVLSTDKTGYLAGDAVSISGTGFTAGEVVTLLVTHASGAAEPGAGHDPIIVSADEAGNLSATWAVGDDPAGHDFILSATRAVAPAVAPVRFMRIAVVSTDKYDYQPGETVIITGAGFRNGEAVRIHVVHSTGRNDGNGHEPFETLADTSGRIGVGWFVDPDDSLGSIFRLTATGSESGLIATTTFTDVIITQVDDQGPDDEPGQKDLNQMSSELGSAALALTWNWDDTEFGNLGGNTGDACALVDTNQDGFANYAFCVVVDGNPAVKISNRLYTCNNSRSDRCAGPTLVPTFTSSSTASVVSNSDPFRLPPFNAAHSDGNDCDDDANCLTHDTVANVTLVLNDVGGATLAKLLNVCSYPSQEPNSDPSDCVVTPDSGFLTIVKNADPSGTPFTFTTSEASQGGLTSWTITPSGGTGSVVQIPFEATTTLDLTEAIPATWKLTNVSCAIQTAPATPTGTAAATPVLGEASAGVTDLEIRAGLETICTFTDAKQQGYIKVRKETVGGITGQNYDFQFTPSGFGGNAPFTLTTSGVGGSNETVSFGPLDVNGTYSVSETSLPTGWELTGSSCTNGTPAAIVVTDGQTTVCTFTNQKKPTLTLLKTVLNNNGGNEPDTAWTLSASGPTPLSGLEGSAAVTNAVVTAGTYTLTESGPDGYSQTDLSCVGGTLVGNELTLANGDSATCTFTNDDRPAKITLIKEVVNDNNGDATPNDFGLTIGGTAVTSGQTLDVHSNTAHALNEVGLTGYTFVSITGAGCPATLGGTVTLNEGQEITCTIRNDDQPAKITLIKEVVNDNNGDATPNDFGLTIGGTAVTSGQTLDVNSNTAHALNEVGLTGYTFVSITGAGCPATLGGTVTLNEGQEITCTIRNDDQPAKITLIKVVVNDNGGNADVNDFGLTIGGTSVNSGQTRDVSSNTPIALNEAGLTGYSFVSITGTGCPATLGGTVTLNEGQEITCTITNDDQPAKITLIKYVVNDNGGTAGVNDFGLTIGGAAVTSGQKVEVNSNSAIALNEAGLTGYSFVSITGTGCPAALGGTVTLDEGQEITCTIRNNDNPPSLTLVKQVDNTYCGYGCATAADFTLTASGYNPASPAAGTYNLSESAIPGYALVSLTCSDTGTTPVTSVTLSLGESVTCTFVNRAIPGILRVRKVTVPSTDDGLFNLTIGGTVMAANVGNGGDTGPVSVQTGIAIAVAETAGTDTSLSDYVSKIKCGAADEVAGTSTNVYLTPGAELTCTITNTKKGMVTVHKLTNGEENTSMTWNFRLNGSGVNTTDSSPPTLVDFGSAKLVPGSVYTVCETGIPAGWTLEWKVDTNNDSVPDTIIPFYAGGNAPPSGWTDYSNVYDPNYVAPPNTYTNDTRCVQFTVQADQTLAFEINNAFPGGEPRTIGYWKNWNTCTGGNQATTAANNGGPAAGWYILNDLLNNPGYHLGPANGTGLQLDGNSANALTGSVYQPSDCIAAVRILDKSRITDGRKLASDGAYNLAAQLLAALLNLSAGAETCGEVTDAVNGAQSLLLTIGFNGTAQTYLKSNNPLYSTANSYAATLDRYNNGNLCGQ